MHPGYYFPLKLMVLAEAETTTVGCRQLSFPLFSRVDSGGDILLVWRTMRKKKGIPLLLPVVVGRASFLENGVKVEWRLVFFVRCSSSFSKNTTLRRRLELE